MPFLLLLILTLTCLQPRWPAPPSWLEPVNSLALVWGGVVGLWLLAGWLAHTLGRELTAAPELRPLVLRRFAAWRRYHFYALLAFYLIALYLLGWGWVVRESLTALLPIFPGQELVTLAPFFIGLILAWARFYDVEWAAHHALDGDAEAFLDRQSYVLLQMRHNMLLVAPPLFLLLVQQIVLCLFPTLQTNDFFMPILGVGLLAGVFLTIPFFLRLLLGLRPLPDGPLRTRLLETMQRLHFRCNNLLVWNTRNTVANAMVTGPVPWLRYVILTDRLIRDLTPEEVEAVFGHEVGHVKHRHMLFYICFLLASLVVLGGVWGLTESFLQQDHVRAYMINYIPYVLESLESLHLLAVLPLLILTALYLFLVFGFLARRCERQADIFGCRTVSCEVFIAALEKVAVLNGIPRERPGWLSSWQHSTIAQRVAFLQRLSTDPTLEARFQRRVGILKWGMALGLVGVLLALGPQRVWDILMQL